MIISSNNNLNNNLGLLKNKNSRKISSPNYISKMTPWWNKEKNRPKISTMIT